MQLGSQEHKAQFVEEKIKIHSENVWAMEIQLLHARKELANKKAYLDLIPGKLERKEYDTANAGRKDQRDTEEAIELLEQQVAKIEGDISNQEIAIQKTQQWADDNAKA